VTVCRICFRIFFSVFTQLRFISIYIFV
jgi:hypothetical protein